MKELNEFQIKINPIMESLSRYNNFYHFSSFFKVDDFIIEKLMKKYEVNQKYFPSKYYTSENLSIGYDIKFSKNQIPEYYYLSNEIILAIYEFNEQKVFITKDKIYGYNTKFKDCSIKDIVFDKNKCLIFNNINFNDKTIDEYKKNNANVEEVVTSIELPDLLYELLNELKILNSKVNISINKHPLINYDFKTKFNYIKILAFRCVKNKYLVANQIVKLEQVARQFNINSNKLKSLLVNAFNLSKEEYDKEFETLINNLNYEFKNTFIIDMAFFEVVDKNQSKNIIKIEKEFENKFDLSFSNILDVKYKVKEKIKDFYI